MELPASQRVVVVDDDPATRRYLDAVLSGAGYQCEAFESASTALGWLEQAMELSSILLCDIDMPGMDGIEMLERVRNLSVEKPFIMLSGNCDEPLMMRALKAGATEYLFKPAKPDVVLALVSKHVQGGIRDQLRKAKTTLDDFLGARNLSGGQSAAQLLPVFSLLGLKRIETLQHSMRVARYSMILGRALGLSAADLAVLEIGALLHDIGKAAIPSNILLKPGKLNDEEARIMRMHAQLGYDMLAGLPGMHPESRIVHTHHERFDGRGYPRRLRGQEIPLAARIFSVADTLDAMTSDRCYRLAGTFADARAEIFAESGMQFDPAVVDALAVVPDAEFQAVRARFPDLVEEPVD
jgi:putative nucleotidyltransferase with HDIG domain